MSFFELLSKIPVEDVREKLFKEGKAKAYCPIRFLTDEQMEELKREYENKNKEVEYKIS